MYFGERRKMVDKNCYHLCVMFYAVINNICISVHYSQKNNISTHEQRIV
jgi:hypothetical protein